MCLSCGIASKVGFAQRLTSCSLLNMKKLSGKVHVIWKPFLDGVNEKMHQCLLAVLRLCVHQLPYQNTHNMMKFWTHNRQYSNANIMDNSYGGVFMVWPQQKIHPDHLMYAEQHPVASDHQTKWNDISTTLTSTTVTKCTSTEFLIHIQGAQKICCTQYYHAVLICP